MRFLAIILLFTGYALVYAAVAAGGIFAQDPWSGLFGDAYVLNSSTSTTTTQSTPNSSGGSSGGTTTTTPTKPKGNSVWSIVKSWLTPSFSIPKL